MQGEYSQPFLKPPHLDQPVSTLLLSESTMAFGRALVNNSDGNYRGSLMLPLKEGYVIIFIVTVIFLFSVYLYDFLPPFGVGWWIFMWG